MVEHSKFSFHELERRGHLQIDKLEKNLLTQKAFIQDMSQQLSAQQNIIFAKNEHQNNQKIKLKEMTQKINLQQRIIEQSEKHISNLEDLKKSNLRLKEELTRLRKEMESHDDLK